MDHLPLLVSATIASLVLHLTVAFAPTVPWHVSAARHTEAHRDTHAAIQVRLQLVHAPQPAPPALEQAPLLLQTMVPATTPMPAAQEASEPAPQPAAPTSAEAPKPSKPVIVPDASQATSNSSDQASTQPNEDPTPGGVVDVTSTYWPASALDILARPVDPMELVDLTELNKTRFVGGLQLLIYIGEYGGVDRVEILNSEVPPGVAEAVKDKFARTLFYPAVRRGYKVKSLKRIEVCLGGGCVPGTPVMPKVVVLPGEAQKNSPQ